MSGEPAPARPSTTEARGVLPGAGDATLRICLLGTPRLAWSDGRMHPLQRRDAALLAMLVLDGPAPRSRVAVQLWPDADPEGARNNLRQRLFRLRRTAARDVVTADDVLRLADGIGHDLEPPAARPDGAPPSADGELLGDLDYADCAELGDWVDSARERWRTARLQALAAIADGLEARRELAQALVYAEHLLAADPLAEPAHRRVMRLHYLRGERAAASAAYERLRRLLDGELGAAPERETRELAALIERSAAPPIALARALPPAVLRPPRLVGREPQWAAAQAAWHDGEVVCVVGEAGIGKSRFLDDFAAAHLRHAGAAARPGDGPVPYALLARLLRALPRPTTLPGWARDELARLLPEWGPTPATRTDPLALREAAAALLAEAAAAAAGDGPLTLVLDDLHFADAATLETLPALMAAPTLRWLLGSRPAGEAGADAAVAIAALASLERPPLRRIELTPLDRAEVRTLIESLGLPGIDADAWAPALWRHSGGNPLFLLETLRAALRDDAAPALQALPKPAPLAELIGRRLERLSAAALRLARLASIADSDFDIALGAAVLGVHPIDLADPWRELEAAQIVRDGGFAHDLVLDATRAAIPDAVARTLHAQIAEQLARRGLPAARVAMHWQAAQRWAEAAATHEAAARQALAASRRHDELMHRRQVIAACNKSGDVEGAFQARVNTVEPLLVVESVEQAQGLADGLLDDATTPAQRLAAQLARAQTFLMAARAAEAMVAADEARTLAAAADDRSRERIAARYLAVGLAQAQRADEAVALLEPYQAGLPDDPADDDTYRFWSDMAYALQAANQRARCAAALERAIAGGEARGDLAEVLTNLSNLSGVKGNLGRLDAALVDAQRAQRLSERLGDVAGIPAGALHIHLGLLSACSGRLGSALRHFDSAHELFVKAGQNTWVAVARNHRADVLLNLGQVARARQALPADDDALLRPTRARRLIVAAHIERALGHSPLPLLTQAIAVLGPVGDPYMGLLAKIDALRAQDPAEAAEAALELEAQAQRIEHLAVATKARWYRADALRRAGRIDDAVALVRLARAEFATTQPWDMYIPETWSIERRVGLDAGDAEAARVALRGGLAWIEAALGDVPEEFRDSFRHRNPINDGLLAARNSA